MAPIHGRPFLEYLLNYWIEQGIRTFVLSVGYLGEKIEAHFGSSYRGCAIRYVREQMPLGTGGGFRQSVRQTNWEQPHVLLVNGDTWYEASLDQLVADTTALSLPIAITLKPMNINERYGAVGIDANKNVIDFGIKTDERCLINAGCYLFEIDQIIRILKGYPEAFSLEQEFLVPMAREKKIVASIQDVTFLDIGVPLDYAQASKILVPRTEK